MITLPYRKMFGARIRKLREMRGWSQGKAAAHIPLSQKQWSRLELGDVSAVDRHRLIRLAEIFESPMSTGEVNQWLHVFGYRPHIEPLLPLPPNVEGILAHYPHQPAVIIDIGRYLRYANEPMADLYHINVRRLGGIRRNWLWHYFHPDGILYRAYPPDSEERVLNRLFWDWQPYYHEAWNQNLRRELEEALGVSWTELETRYDIPSEPLAMAMSETITVPNTNGRLLLFQNQAVDIPYRPDLLTIVYRPMNPAAENWCRMYADPRRHA